MSDLDIFDEMLTEEALVSVQKDSGGKFFLVLSEGSGQETYQIEIRNIPKDIIAFKADKFPAPETVFKCGKGECKRADYVLVANRDNKNWIIYLEMKRGSAKANAIMQQLKGAECLVAYCRAIGRAFWQAKGFLKENDYRQRFVSIKNVSVNKLPTRNSSKSSVHDKPENMLKINSPGKKLQFNKLVEG